MYGDGEQPGAEGRTAGTTDGDAGIPVDSEGADGTDGATDDDVALNEKLVSIENLIGSSSSDILVGSRAPNTLSGGKGDDMLYGREGDDVLVGGEDADILTGGAGADTFVFGPLHAVVPAEQDAIMDFRPSEGDKIDLTAFGLNSGQLRELLAQDTNASDGVTLNLSEVTGVSGGGVIQVTISDQFAALTVGDFIIEIVRAHV